MRAPFQTPLLALCVVLAISGCARLADSNLNPSNWFASGGGGLGQNTATGELQALVPEGARTLVLDARRPVSELTGVALDRTPDGAILRATGRTPTQGWFNAELVLVSVEGRIATYEFRAEAPRTGTQTGTGASRQITAAVNISNEDLAGFRSFRVRAANGSRTVGR